MPAQMIHVILHTDVKIPRSLAMMIMLVLMTIVIAQKVANMIRYPVMTTMLALMILATKTTDANMIKLIVMMMMPAQVIVVIQPLVVPMYL